MPRLDPECPQRVQLQPCLVTWTEIKDMGDRLGAQGRPVEARSQREQLLLAGGEVGQTPAVTGDQGAQMLALAGTRPPTMSEARGARPSGPARGR
jgi:hypothetical protein